MTDEDLTHGDVRFKYLDMRARCESPIEELFFDAWFADDDLPLIGLEVAYSALGGRYRLDFAVPRSLFAIELDGWQYHSGREQFTRDRRRQRELEGEGWRFARFSGREVNADPAACVRQADELHQRSILLPAIKAARKMLKAGSQ